jgi:hypothetical protein
MQKEPLSEKESMSDLNDHYGEYNRDKAGLIKIARDPGGGEMMKVAGVR